MHKRTCLSCHCAPTVIFSRARARRATQFNMSSKHGTHSSVRGKRTRQFHESGYFPYSTITNDAVKLLGQNSLLDIYALCPPAVDASRVPAHATLFRSGVKYDMLLSYCDEQSYFDPEFIVTLKFLRYQETHGTLAPYYRP